MRNIRLLTWAITICFLTVSLMPIAVQAVTPVPTRPAITYNGIDYDMYFDSEVTPIERMDPPDGYIAGYVLNEEGRPVEGAMVSLLQNGQLWSPDKYGFFPGMSNYQTRNPDWTRRGYEDDEGFVKAGGFLFSLPISDAYTIVAEKDGYTGSATVIVGPEIRNTSDLVARIITVNITLTGYHKQSLYSSKKLSYTGAIVGDIWDASGGKTAARISLYQDGQLMDEPYNPQFAFGRNGSSKHIDYRFLHLAPGPYTVNVDSPQGNGTVSVNVGTDIMRADVVVSKDDSPKYVPRQGFMPTVGPYFATDIKSATTSPSPDTSDAEPSPALAWWATAVVMVTMTYILLRRRDRI